MRNREAWKRKRKAAREHGRSLTGQLPGWIEEKDGERRLKPEFAAIMKRIFQLTANGYGLSLIIKRFLDEGVPHFLGKHWTRSYLATILKDRRALGEYQPRLSNGDPDGEVIKDYYPAAVTEDEWLAARAGAAQRYRHRGRKGQYVNVFAGLVKNAIDGDSYFASTWQKNGQKRRILTNHAGADGRAKRCSFPFETFEKAVLDLLDEIDPHSILNGHSGPDETLGLSGKLHKVEAELGEAVAFMNQHGFSVAIGKRVTELETQKQRLTEQLAEARQKARHPLSETWGECKTLLGAIGKGDESNERRLRLQTVLRRMIDSIWLLVVPRGRDRLAAVQIWFAGGKRHRDYLVVHRQPRGNRHNNKTKPGGTWCDSLDPEDATDLDLRQREDAEAYAELLSEWDYSDWLTPERAF